MAVTIAVLLGSCATAPATREDKAELVAEATSRWQQMRTADPALGALVQRAMAMPCFPMWGRRASAWAAPTAGEVYERGQHIGFSDLTQGTGGRGGPELQRSLVFEHKAALDRFKAGQFGFAAGASAVVLKSGVATTQLR